MPYKIFILNELTIGKIYIFAEKKFLEIAI